MAYSRIAAAAAILVLATYTVFDAFRAETHGPTFVIDVVIGGAVASAALLAFAGRWFSSAGLRYLMLVGVILNIPSVGQPFVWSAYELGRQAAIVAAIASGLFLMWKERRPVSR